jgi:hypothetical protein
MIKFITFKPSPPYDEKGYYTNSSKDTTCLLNEWLEEHPRAEIINWQACPVGDHNELYITVQYKEN